MHKRPIFRIDPGFVMPYQRSLHSISNLSSRERLHLLPLCLGLAFAGRLGAPCDLDESLGRAFAQMILVRQKHALVVLAHRV